MHAAGSTETEKKVRPKQIFCMIISHRQLYTFFPVELISSSSESVSDDVGGIEVDSVEECPSDTAAMSNGDSDRSDASTESSDPDVHNEEV